MRCTRVMAMIQGRRSGCWKGIASRSQRRRYRVTPLPRPTLLWFSIPPWAVGPQWT